jgi:phosphatidate cytidylyltransferase
MAQDAKKKSDLIPRLTTAVIAIPVLLGVIFYAPAEAFFALITAAGAISAWEYVRITCASEIPALPWLVAAITGALMGVQYFLPQHLLLALMVAAVGTFLYMLFGYTDQKRSTHHLGSSLTAMLYGGLMLGCFALMRKAAGDAGPLFVIMMLGIIWGSDTGAYFAGKAFGKHKLYPAVSPNKSIEGSVGGVITSVLLVVGFNALFAATSDAWTSLTIVEILLLSIPGNILGQLGDLCESLVKRAHDVKDSGTIIYGHGGMLDRIDALIIASPWFYFFIEHIHKTPPA